MEQSELLCPSAAADCAPLAERPELEDLEGVAVKRYGLGFFPDLLNDSLQSELRTYVQLNSPAGGKAHEPRRVLLDLHDLPVQRAVLAAMSDAPLRAVLEELLGKDAALVELAAKHSSYGSWSQSWHKDAVTCTGNAESYTLLIPLQETTGESGAEALCVGTHRCLLGDSDCDDFGDGQSIHATAGGTGVLMHRSLYHRGCAHTAASAPDAVMFYISWMSSHGLMPPGTYAMRRDHFGRTMDDILTGAWSQKWWTVQSNGRGYLDTLSVQLADSSPDDWTGGMIHDQPRRLLWVAAAACMVVGVLLALPALITRGGSEKIRWATCAGSVCNEEK